MSIKFNLRRIPIVHRHSIVTVENNTEWKATIKADWKSGMTKKDSGYRFSSTTFVVIDDTLYVRFKGYKEKSKYLVLNNMSSFTANQVIQSIPNMGRHFEDGIHQVWHDLGLPLGYVVSIFRR